MLVLFLYQRFIFAKSGNKTCTLNERNSNDKNKSTSDTIWQLAHIAVLFFANWQCKQSASIVR